MITGMSSEHGARTADRLLMLLKTRGTVTTRALAGLLDISVPAVRQHLRSMDELVTCETVNQGIGRPAQAWRLTPAGQARFPDTHAEMTVRLIGFIQDSLGPQALQQVLDSSYQQSLEDYTARLHPLRSLGGRVRRLAQIRAEEGYMAEVRRQGAGWQLVEHHCPICAAATACQGFCSNELALFRAVLGDEADVQRTEYLLDGGERCAYFISRRRP
jgi:predicted ArsR family transcriptional regulator